VAKKARIRHLCTFCETRLREGEAFCEACGTPTVWASHEQKVAWELERYSKDRGKLIEEIPEKPLPVVPRVYSRRAAPQHEPSRALRAIPTVEKPAAASPVRLPVRRQSLEVEMPSAEDQAMLFKIVRILNQRIADLEDRIEELEGALSGEALSK
jgi:hypothetical protein